MAELGYDGKVAIITGGGNGLGREHALLLASRGAQVVVNDLGGNVAGDGSDLTAAESVAKEIEAAGGVAVADGNSVSTQAGGAAGVVAEPHLGLGAAGRHPPLQVGDRGRGSPGVVAGLVREGLQHAISLGRAAERPGP